MVRSIVQEPIIEKMIYEKSEPSFLDLGYLLCYTGMLLFFPPSPSCQVSLPINSGVSAVAALYSYWGWVREDCKQLNRSHCHLQLNPAILPVDQAKVSSCFPVPYPFCSASALKKFANFGVCPWKSCCCYQKSECVDFDLSSYSIIHFLIFFGMIIIWSGSLLACSLFVYAEDRLH